MEPIDPDAQQMYCTKGRRLTPMRVAGLAFENAMRAVYLNGIWTLREELVSTVDFNSVSRHAPDGPRGTVTFLVAEPHRRALLSAAEDVAVKLQEYGYAMVGAVVDEPGCAQHDLVLDFRKQPRAAGKFSCELKFLTAPADLQWVRERSAPLFLQACERSSDWVGQVIVVVEVTRSGDFLRSRAELLLKGSRDAPHRIWGWDDERLRARIQLPSTESVEEVAVKHRVLLFNANVLWGDQKRIAISTVLDLGHAAIDACNVGGMLEALCTAVALMTPPRRAPSVPGESARAAAPETTESPMGQPQLRELVARLLGRFDVEQAETADRLREPIAHLSRLLERLDLGVAACSSEWRAITKAMGRRDPTAEPKRKRGGSMSGVETSRRLQKLEDLSKEGAWHACKRCGPWGGRWILVGDEAKTTRQCWGALQTGSCQFSTTVSAWRRLPEMTPDQAIYAADAI
jgi:hypothetical protein